MVPAGQDINGSFFMANGFSAGYFGMQVNSPTEKRVLFSIWSPFSTNDPALVPDKDKVHLLRKGENTITQVFGGEGSGA